MQGEAIKELDAKGLRQFGLTTGAIVGLLFGGFFPWVLERPLPMWPWAVFAVLAVWALLAPRSLQPVYRAWMKLGLVLNRITTPIAIGALFIVLIVPVALIMRLAKSDPLNRRIDAAAESYRVPSRRPARENLERPF